MLREQPAAVPNVTREATAKALTMRVERLTKGKMCYAVRAVNAVGAGPATWSNRFKNLPITPPPSPPGGPPPTGTPGGISPRAPATG